MKTDHFHSCGHCWVFQICWHIVCSTFIASSFRIWNSSTGIPSIQLALFIVMLPKAHFTSHSSLKNNNNNSPKWKELLKPATRNPLLSQLKKAAQGWLGSMSQWNRPKCWLTQTEFVFWHIFLDGKNRQSWRDGKVKAALNHDVEFLALDLDYLNSYISIPHLLSDHELAPYFLEITSYS